MSEEVETTAAEIMPAKSEDKLEIEKEEKEKKKEEEGEKVENKEGEGEDKKEVEQDGETEKEKKEENSEEDLKDKKDTDADKKEEGGGSTGSTGSSTKEKEVSDKEKGGEENKKNKFKLKTPKVPEFLRSKSKDRKKDKGEKKDSDEEKTEKAEKDDAEKKSEGEDSKEEDKSDKEKDSDKKKDDSNDEDSDKKEDDEEDTKKEESKDAKSKFLDKMPKFHKPKFMKKKGDDAETADSKNNTTEMQEIDAQKDKEEEDTEESKKEKGEKKDEASENKENEDSENKAADKEEEGTEKKTEEGEKEENQTKDESEEKKSSGGGFLDSLRSMAVPSIFSSKKNSKDKDVEAGKEEDQEETKELLEKSNEKEDEKEKEDAGSGENKEAGKNGVADEEKEKEGEEDAKLNKKVDDNEADSEKKTEEKKKSGGFLESLRHAATNVPSLFTRKTDKDSTDLEAGETKELLEKDEDEDKKDADADDSNKKSEEKEAEDKTENNKKDPDAASATGSEKKDPEKGEEEKPTKKCEIKIINEFEYMDSQKKCGLIGMIVGLLALILLIILIACLYSSSWTNEARMSADGKFIQTHTMCGPVRGSVDGPSQFSFYGLSYTAWPLSRFAHSRLPSSVNECRIVTSGGSENNNASSPAAASNGCARRSGSDVIADDDADDDQASCLTLDIFTSSVVYDELAPVVVVLAGEEDDGIEPNSALAQKHGVVFVSVRYRVGVMGFMALKDLARATYPEASGNYGLGDIVSALKWISRNIQHFGGLPRQVTVFGSGPAATLATALTATPTAQGLFQRVWATNGAGVFKEQGIGEANRQNRRILDKLGCGANERQCIMDKDIEDIIKAVPEEWYDLSNLDLPMKGEKSKEHSWLINDKEVMFDTPDKTWEKQSLNNKVPIVFGASAHSAANANLRQLLRSWNDSDEFAAHVESKLGSFNASIPGQALELYNAAGGGDHWASFAAMLTDIRTICPLQDLALTASNNFVAPVFSYVATGKRTTDLGNLADAGVDVAAIFGEDGDDDSEDERKFVSNMKEMFFEFVRSGQLPQNKDLKAGMYLVGSEIKTQSNYPACQFWKQVEGIVPEFANLD